MDFAKRKTEEACHKPLPSRIARHPPQRRGLFLSVILFYSRFLLFAINATVDAVFNVSTLKDVVELLLGSGNTSGVGTLELVDNELRALFGAVIFIRALEQLQNERHTDILCVERLLEIASSRILVYLGADLINSGQRMKHAHIALCLLHFFGSKDIAVLESLIFIRIIY